MSLAKTGTGNLTLSGVNTFTGTATVNAGTITLANSGALGGACVPYNTGFIFAGNIGNFTLGNLSGGNNLNMVDANNAAINLTIGSQQRQCHLQRHFERQREPDQDRRQQPDPHQYGQAYTGSTTVAGGSWPSAASIRLPNGQPCDLHRRHAQSGRLQLRTPPATVSFQGGTVTGGTVNNSGSKITTPRRARSRPRWPAPWA